MRRTARPWLITITVEGLNLGRFLRLAGEAGIRLHHVQRRGHKRLTALMCENEITDIQQIISSGGWTLHTGARKGAGRAAQWLHRRWLLTAAIAMAGIALWMCSQVMWRVEIIDAGTYQADIGLALTEMGVVPPKLRSQVDMGELRCRLEWRYPRIAWFECGWRGTALEVRAVEGVLPLKESSPDEPCDVVAARDAIVQQVVTKAGTAAVQPGDFVHAGEVLIKGEERTSNGEVKAVSAEGSVTGRVWIGAAVEMSAAVYNTEYTGQEQRVWTVRTPWFDLWPMAQSPYEFCDIAVSEQVIGGMFIPMKLHAETRKEAVINSITREQDELCEDAARAARRKLQEKMMPEESLIDIWENCSMINNEKVRAQAIGEMLVEIGVQQVSSGMAAPGE